MGAVPIKPHRSLASRRVTRSDHIRGLSVLASLLLQFLIAPAIILAIGRAVPVVIANIALNTSMNEVFHAMINCQFLPPINSGSLDATVIVAAGDGSGSTTTKAVSLIESMFIHSETENYTLYGPSTLYRKTTGFRGPLAFNVSIDQNDLPNVLVLVVESFRYHDSRYLAANNSYLFYDTPNLTITPNFDRWAKQGIAFRNFWSSWRTSRSLESVLFGQVPYDSVTASGTTTGNSDIKLSGMPQLFKAKGYETAFTSGARTNYDQWDRFLPTHGFEQVLAMNEFKQMAQDQYGIKPEQWDTDNDARAMGYWGVHDDIALKLLGDIIEKKLSEQKARVQAQQPKKPFFINHYTISSHTPFEDRPKWYDQATKPDFRAMYANKPYEFNVRNYMEMRYFTDMALGQLLDRLNTTGALNDMIVVVVGDHGQGPEYGLDTPEARHVSATRVASMLLAQGRLDKASVGMMFDDAAEQYDLLNTLADMIGLPDGGFDQTGVGRSLMRRIPFGQRVVWANNPTRKMGVIRGHMRLEYDRAADDMGWFDTEADHEQKHDLTSTLTAAQQQELRMLRSAGRTVSNYFKDRWEKRCILAATCK